MKEIDRLINVIDHLRGRDGCPWDRAQTLRSLQPQLLDEAYEVLDAINTLDGNNLQEELGDLLFGTLMLCRLAEKEAGISLDDVTRGIEEKMIRRHPHVFGNTEVDGAEEVVRNWEEIKFREKNASRPDSIFHDELRHLPALRRAQRIQKKARSVGFDWDEISGVIDKIREELSEVEDEIKSGKLKRQEEELGDLLFSVVNLVRFMGFDAELALQKMISRWICRFQKLEKVLKERGKKVPDVSFEELDSLWGDIAETEK